MEDLGLTIYREINCVKVRYPSKRTIVAHDLRGAIRWATKYAPAYYCIAYQNSDSVESGKFPLVVIQEKESNSITNLFRELLSDARKFACNQWYTDLSKKQVDKIIFFEELVRHHQATAHLCLEPAPFVEEWQMGARLITDWIGALKIPKDSILFSQLSTLTLGSMADTSDEQYYAAHCLSYLIAALEKDPWVTTGLAAGFGISNQPTNILPKNADRKDPGGWT